MSRAFNGTTSYLESTPGTPPVAGSPFSMAVWYKPASAVNGTAFSLGSTVDRYAALGMNGTGNVFFEVSEFGEVTVNAGALAIGAWNLIGAVQSADNARVAYKGAVAGPPSAVSKTWAAAPNRITVGALVTTGSRVSFANGEIAWAGLWNVALSGSDFTSLAAGTPFDAVQAANLVDLWKLTGTDSPELDSKGSNPLTVSGASAGATDPPILTAATYTRSGILVVGP